MLALLVLALAAAAGRELDPAACGARFDVQRNKIIRTEESREMGARYLSELDVGGRPECLRLCCETDACDVFVYEEKSPGSCYLFACGPPEDFRCKFTAHGNFSAGVMQMSRRLAELQDQERAPPPRAPLPPPTPAPTLPPPQPPTTHRSTTTTTTPPPPPRITPAPAIQLPPVIPCNRYEFACATGGECIAVYNACDGIAQCSDGSDEAPALACPPPPPRDPPPPPRDPPPPPRDPPQPPPQMPPREIAQELGSDHWPHRLLQAQPPRHYPESEMRIFSHTGGLLQDPSWPRRTHVPGMEGGSEPRERWEEAGEEWEPRRAWPVPPAPPARSNGNLLEGGTMPELPAQYSVGGAPHDAPKKRPPAPPAPPPPAPTTPAPVTLTTTHMPATPPALSPAAARVDHSLADETDGYSEKPPAALLLLILGVAATLALLAALGCGARTHRRRRRHTHSHDYLVNGMYL